jgi:hypothetical protein
MRFRRPREKEVTAKGEGDTNLNPLHLLRIVGLVVLGGKEHCVVTRNQGARVACEKK